MSKQANFIKKISNPLIFTFKWIALQASNFVASTHLAHHVDPSSIDLSYEEKRLLTQIDEKTKSASKKFQTIVSLMAKVETNKMFEILEMPLEQGEKHLNKTIGVLLERSKMKDTAELPWNDILLHFIHAGGVSLLREASTSWSQTYLHKIPVTHNQEEESLKSIWKLFTHEILQIFALCKQLCNQPKFLHLSKEGKEKLIAHNLLQSNNHYKKLSKISNYCCSNNTSHHTQQIQLFLIQDSTNKWAKFYITIGSLHINKGN